MCQIHPLLGAVRVKGPYVIGYYYVVMLLLFFMSITEVRCIMNSKHKWAPQLYKHTDIY